MALWNKNMEIVAREQGIWQRMSVRRDGDFYRITSDRADLVEDICTSLGGIVFERDAVADLRPVFGNKPVLKPASPTECLNALWLVFQNGRRLVQGTSGVDKLYADLARLVNKIPCWILRPGSPGETRHLLRDLAEQLGENDRASQ
ncbi:MAG: hypothetical protein Q8Q12_01745 [bacterium]|nr:hypothetical protein [bacterium]